MLADIRTFTSGLRRSAPGDPAPGRCISVSAYNLAALFSCRHAAGDVSPLVAQPGLLPVALAMVMEAELTIVTTEGLGGIAPSLAPGALQPAMIAAAADVARVETVPSSSTHHIAPAADTPAATSSAAASISVAQSATLLSPLRVATSPAGPIDCPTVTPEMAAEALPADSCINTSSAPAHSAVRGHAGPGLDTASNGDSGSAAVTPNNVTMAFLQID